MALIGFAIIIINTQNIPLNYKRKNIACFQGTPFFLSDVDLKCSKPFEIAWRSVDLTSINSVS